MLDYDVFPGQRQLLIRDLLRKDGRVVCAQLAQELKVSEHTIRRDLQELAREGVCQRVYGGAVGLSSASGSFAERRGQGAASKARLSSILRVCSTQFWLVHGTEHATFDVKKC